MEPIQQVNRDTIYIFGESACLAYLTADKFLVMVSQFRKAAGIQTIEIPGGLVESNESSSEAAIREFSEETGLHADNAELLFKLDMDLSVSIHQTSVFVHQSSQYRRFINTKPSVELISLHDAEKKCFSGEITHAPSVAAIMAISRKGQ
jgi:ADP-ribose pyrophosphatase